MDKLQSDRQLTGNLTLARRLEWNRLAIVKYPQLQK